jgi:hypothetical protein
VVIDGGSVEVTYANYNLRDDGVCRWIYFEYQHSIHEVVIVAEFPLLFFWLACVSAAWLVLFLERHLKKKG